MLSNPTLSNMSKAAETRLRSKPTTIFAAISSHSVIGVSRNATQVLFSFSWMKSIPSSSTPTNISMKVSHMGSKKGPITAKSAPVKWITRRAIPAAIGENSSMRINMPSRTDNFRSLPRITRNLLIIKTPSCNFNENIPQRCFLGMDRYQFFLPDPLGNLVGGLRLVEWQRDFLDIIAIL